MTDIVVLTADRLGQGMAGPALRATRIAEELDRQGHTVRLESTAGPVRRSSGLVGGSDVVVVQGPVTLAAPEVLRSDAVVVVDLYDPLHLEQLERRSTPQRGHARDVALSLRLLRDQLRRGDYFLCAHEAQRQLWLGHLAGLGRLTPATYDEDLTLRRLIDVVPYGIPDGVPSRVPGVLRDVVPGLRRDHRVVVWGGGLYEWLDPVTVIRAIGLLAGAGVRVSLVLLGTTHPNAAVATMRTHDECRRVADALGLTGRQVFFVEGWVGHDEHGSRLLDADAGVSAHHPHLEARFSIRARLLDYWWAGLPVVTTDGDPIADLVRREGAGLVVAPGDTLAMARALEIVLTDPARRSEMQAAIRRLVPALAWGRALEPLVAFCSHPARAADAGAGVPRMPGPPRRRTDSLRSATGRVLRRAGVRRRAPARAGTSR